MKYRAEIDGLRALAVVPVILFHVGFEFFSGGFVGVDVFFVISGYLITTILISDLQNKSFNIFHFYERRARRILPALYSVLTVGIVYAFYTSPFYARDIFQSIFATTLFVENLLLLVEASNYFELGVDEKLLFHTWSLAVEEQFYLIFPIFLVIAWRWGQHRVFQTIVMLTTISLVFSEWGWRQNATANFYLAPTRAWELFAGSIAAFIVHKYQVRKKNPLALIGLVAIVASIFAYDEHTPFPSLYALVPVLGVVLILLYAEKSTLVAKVLSTKIFVGVGLISYSAYLWHQPLIIILARELSGSDFLENTLNFGLTAFILTIVLATLSYYLIELPFRYKIRTKIFSFIFISMTFVILTISFFGHTTVGYQSLKLNNFVTNKTLYIDHFKEQPRSATVKISEQKFDLPSLLVIGDSMAADFSKALALKGVKVEIFEVDGYCFEGLVVQALGCSHTLQDIVSISSSFDYVFLATDNVGDKNIESSLIFYEMLTEFVDIYIVNSFRFAHASDISYRYSTGREAFSNKAVFTTLRKEVHEINAILKSKKNLQIIDKYSFFCNDKTSECLLYSDNNEPLRYDELHLTLEGLKYYGNRLMEGLCLIDSEFCE